MGFIRRNMGDEPNIVRPKQQNKRDYVENGEWWIREEIYVIPNDIMVELERVILS